MDRLPAACLALICENFDDLNDIYSLERTNRRIRNNIAVWFWGQPQRLAIIERGEERKVEVSLKNGRKFNASVPNLLPICQKARNLSEFDFSTIVTEDLLLDAVDIIRHNVRCIRTLCLRYAQPDLMYAPRPRKRYSSSDLSAPKPLPSKRTHLRICDLITAHAPTLNSVTLKIDGNGTFAIRRNPFLGELNVDLDYQCTHNTLFMLQPLFAAFSLGCGRQTEVLRVGLCSSRSVDQNEMVRFVFLFCAHNALPVDGSSLREIHCHSQSSELEAQFDPADLRPHLRHSQIQFHVGAN